MAYLEVAQIPEWLLDRHRTLHLNARQTYEARDTASTEDLSAFYDDVARRMHARARAIYEEWKP